MAYNCYCVSCSTHITPDLWLRIPTCYSPTCRQANSKSYWKHPKIARLLIRAKISCALRSKPALMPYSSFVPRALHDYLKELASRTNDEVPFGSVNNGAVLFADASGFTQLTERLARKVWDLHIRCFCAFFCIPSQMCLIYHHRISESFIPRVASRVLFNIGKCGC